MVFLFLFRFLFLCRAPHSSILPPGVGALYSSPSASFQSLLANISAAQHSAAVHQSTVKQPPPMTTSRSEYLTSIPAASPPISPPITITATTTCSTNRSSPPDDRRSSSIATLRLKAQEHMQKVELEIMRQSCHSDIMS